MPKVPRQWIRPDRSVRLVQLQLGGPCLPGVVIFAHFAYRQNIVRMHRFTWGQLRPTTSAQLGPTWLQLWLSHCATWPQVGPAWAAQDRILKTLVFTGISNFCWALMTLHVDQCSPCCVSAGPNLVRSFFLSSCTTLDVTCTSMCITWPQLPPQNKSK